MKPLKITAYALSKSIGVDQTRIGQLMKVKRAFSADTALRLSIYFKMSPEFWLNAQSRYDLEEEKKNKEKYIEIEPMVLA